MDKSFYQAKSPEEALKIYFEGDSDLYSQTKNKIIKDILNNIFTKSQNSLKVLEVGAGGGVWTDYFIQKGASITSIDICQSILQGNAKLHPEAKFILGDAAVVQFENKFDLIFAKDVIEHMQDDEIFLRNMNFHLENNGLIIITTQNSWSLNYLIQGGYHFLKGNRTWTGWDPTHLRFYNPKSLKTKLIDNGFMIKKWFGTYYLPYRIIADKINGYKFEWNIFHFIEYINLNNIFPLNLLGWNIGIIGQKLKSL